MGHIVSQDLSELLSLFVVLDRWNICLVLSLGSHL